ncbi:MAG: beta-lactamase family protein [Phycisphaerales bacterium]|nr:beta-lactamase family protein [Phycisphaerales bacterium]
MRARPTRRLVHLLATLGAAAASAIASAQAHVSDPAATPAPLPVLTDLPDDPAARLDAVAALLRERLETYRQTNRFPAATLSFVLPDGRTRSIAVGLDGPDPEAPALSPEATFFPGEIETMFLATLVLDLDEDDARELLDLPLRGWLGDREWFARLPNASDLTLRAALGHRTGVPDVMLDPAFLNRVRDEPTHQWTAEEVIGLVLDREPVAPVDERCVYSQVNNVLVALVVEAITGTTVEAAFRARCLDPVGLGDAVVDVPGAAVDGLAQGRVGTHNIFGMPEWVGTNGAYACVPRVAFPGGRWAVSTGGLASWMQALMTERLIDATSLREMRRFTVGQRGLWEAYGLGVDRRSGRVGVAWGHPGWLPGSMVEVTFYPDFNVSMAIALTTTTGVNPRTLEGGLDTCMQVIVAAALAP